MEKNEKYVCRANTIVDIGFYRSGSFRSTKSFYVGHNTPIIYMSRDLLVPLLRKMNGKFFSVIFSKKDNTLREMVCKLSPEPWCSSSGKNILVLENGSSDNYKNIRISSILCLAANGMFFIIDDREEKSCV